MSLSSPAARQGNALFTQTPGLDALTAPVHVGEVTIAVHDLDRVARFYETVIGLDRLDAGRDHVRLGVDGVPLLLLEHRPSAVRESLSDAGLFHTAFLVPSRAALGAWLLGALAARTPIEGASDHAVSEAIYLSDPEGNGIEIYADRPRSAWPRHGSEIEMITVGLDVDGLLAEGRTLGPPTGRIASGTRIGHIHLKVGDVAEAERFWAVALGFDVTHRRPGAAFYSTGGYHHHVATNSWRSRGAGPRLGETTGLVGFELVAADEAAFAAMADRLTKLGAVTRADGAVAIRDPSGVEVALKSPSAA